jgi:cytochrome oxidase Cu insertion factor (SCO1/SenC/PrrC family)
MKTPLFRARLAAGVIFAALIVCTAAATHSSYGQEGPRVLPLRVEIGKKAPDFSLPSARGKTVGLSDFAGHIVLIDFYRGFW